jgi:DNA-binding transcriptional MerR regulator
MGRKPVSRPSDPVGGQPMLKMKELVETTGISKATILYYVLEDLLPPPLKTSPNVAYYPSATIERIQLIRQLQAKHRFSLAQIRTILREGDKGHDLESLIEFNKEIFGQEEGVALKRGEFCQACGLSEAQLQQAVDLKLLIPVSDDAFDSADLSAGKFLAESLLLGLTFDDFAYYARLAEEIVSHEMDLRKRLVRNMSYDEAMATTLTITRNARFFRQYIIERIFKQRALRQPLKQKKK